jgi:heavy metal translocating P-type ATPase
MTDPQACDLCGDPLGWKPRAASIQGVGRRFCCTGCLNVYAILAESGALAPGADPRESGLFRESLRLGLISNRPEQAFTPPEGAEVHETLFQLSGLWCASCGWIIEHALGRESGVVSAEVLFTSDLLKVRFCPQYLPPSRIAERVQALGYRASAYSAGADADRREWQDLLLRLGIAGALWMNVMLFSLVIYASYFGHIAEGARRWVPFILMGLAAPVVSYSAWPVHRLAWYGLRHGRLRMEALISTGVLAAFGYSTVQAFLEGRHYYFDTACALVTLVLAGKALERGAKDRSARAIALLHRLLPRKARIREGAMERFVAIEDLRPGMVFLAKPGERIPADGVVVAGSSSVDESVVTGESALLARGPGDPVVCGSLNAAGVLEVRVTHAGMDSTLAQIVKAVETALSGRTPLDRNVDRVAQVFIPLVLALAVATGAGGLVLGLAPTEAMLRAIAVVVIACPCALGIATPLATTAAVGAASARGILIRDVRVLETFRRVGAVVLDKTGTVTEGRFGVRAAHTPNLALVASLEAYSSHPLGHALVEHARELGLVLEDAAGVEIHEGMGLAGTVAGHRVAAGNLRMMATEGLAPDPGQLELAAGWQDQGLTVVFVAVDGAPGGVLALGDPLRAEAAALVAGLRRRGIRTILLSGDARAATSHTGARLGVDECLGEVPPAGKAEAIRRLQAGGTVVAMVGDGVNDAPALAAADLGIALGSGADLAMHAAPVVLLGDSLLRVEEIFQLALRAQRVVRQNLFWAFGYNVAGIALAMTGRLNPILAAGAMVLSSLSVIGNSLRLGRRSEINQG